MDNSKKKNQKKKKLLAKVKTKVVQAEINQEVIQNGKVVKKLKSVNEKKLLPKQKMMKAGNQKCLKGNVNQD